MHGYLVVPSQPSHLELQKVCDFTPESADYAVTIIYFDQVSNTKKISVKGASQSSPQSLNVNVNLFEKIPESLVLEENGIKWQLTNDKKTAWANFMLKNNSPKSEKLVGKLLLVELDEGITAEREVVVPISSKGDIVSGNFELELDDGFNREGVLYLSINGVFSAPLPTGKEN